MTSLGYRGHHHCWCRLTNRRMRSQSNSGDGISTVCPSPTHFCLGLGPPEHKRTNLAYETLGFRRQRFSLCFSLLIPGFALVIRPPALTLELQPTTRRSPTTHIKYESITSVPGLSPVEFSARNHSISQLLRTV